MIMYIYITLTIEGAKMGEQLHKRFSEEQVKMILNQYVKEELRSEQAIITSHIILTKFLRLF